MKSDHNTNVTPVLSTCGLHLDFTGHFMTFNKIEPTSTKLLFAFLDVNVLGPAVHGLICAEVVKGEIVRF